MDRPNNSNNNNQPQVPFFIYPILMCIGICIGIGNIVRRMIWALLSIPASIFSIIKTIILELISAIKSWIHEKKSSIVSRARSQKHVIYSHNQHVSKLVIQKIRSSLQHIRNLPSRIRSTFSTIRQRYEAYRETQKKKQHIKEIKQSQLRTATNGEISVFNPIMIFSWISSSFRHKKETTEITPLQLNTVNHTTSVDLWKSFITGMICTIIFFFAPFETYRWLTKLPNPQLLSRRDLQVTTKIFDRKGVLLYEIYQDQNRTPLALEKIPSTIVQATIAIEDKDFYRHPGISLKGMARAAREIALKKQVQGGSTITQQLIKSALLSPEIKITRKIKEVILAFWTERLYTKNQILEMYLNQVPYGGTAWGVEAASQTYFGKSATQLTLAESALLAGLPAAPSDYSPFGPHPEKAFERQREVIRRMIEDRYITREDGEAALQSKLQFAKPNTAIRAPHFVMYVKNLLEKKYGERLVDQGGLQIKTSLDISLQEKVEELIRQHISALAPLNVGNGAALVTDPKTGEILAMVGSKNYFDIEAEGNVNVTTALRQPGSSIKVVNYAAALENGFTAASIIDDSPSTFQSAGSPPYIPVNYDGRFHGAVPFRNALANSYNIPAVKILSKIGVSTMIKTGNAMGIKTWGDESRFGLSLTLGGGEVTMLDMAEVYGTLANGGKHTDLHPILDVTDYTGRLYERARLTNSTQALKPETAWIMSDILSDNTARTAAFGPNSSLVIPDKTVSVKTGTTDNKRDNWTIGYTPSYVTTVWVGNNDNSPMNPFLTSGITGAAPIWHDIMIELLKNKQNEVSPKPENIVTIPCYFGRAEYFLTGTQPQSGRCTPLPTPTPSVSPTP